MKKNKTSKNWIKKNQRDPFFRKSKIQGYRSRSAFKLIELNNKFNFLNKNTQLLDLGSYPGGWSQAAKKKIIKGKILAVDRMEMQKIEGVDFILGDILETKTNEEIIKYFDKKIDVVVSDMAINTSGNKNLDAYNTGQLCLSAMKIALKLLDKNGVFISKIFMGSIYNEINKASKSYFKKVVKYKPLSSKKESKEIYIFCKGVLKI